MFEQPATISYKKDRSEHVRSILYFPNLKYKNKK